VSGAMPQPPAPTRTGDAQRRHAAARERAVLLLHQLEREVAVTQDEGCLQRDGHAHGAARRYVAREGRLCGMIARPSGAVSAT